MWLNDFFTWNTLLIYDKKKYIYMVQLGESKDDVENFETHKKIDTQYFAFLYNHTTFVLRNFSLDA